MSGDMKTVLTPVASTPVDVIEYADSYKYFIDMPGIKSEEIGLRVDEDESNDINTVTIIGEPNTKQYKLKAGRIWVTKRSEKLKCKIVLPKKSNLKTISAISKDGLLIVTVEKSPSRVPITRIIKVKSG